MKTRAVDIPTVKSLSESTRSATFIASTGAVDSYGESVDQTTWRLDRFKANPVILYGHKSRELPIGTATSIAVVGGQLEVTIKFATSQANPLAEQVWQAIKEKVIRAVSVGFIPGETREEIRDGRPLTVLRNCELLEISVVAIPANHEALAKSYGTHLRGVSPGQQVVDEILAELDGELIAEDFAHVRDAGQQMVDEILSELDGHRTVHRAASPMDTKALCDELIAECDEEEARNPTHYGVR
jgi:HK97 family phage prohead protease